MAFDSEESKFLNIANRIHEVIVGHVTLLGTWGYVIGDPKFEEEFELRNRIFVLWASALIDTTEASQRFLPDIKADALSEGFDTLVFNADQMLNFALMSNEVLEEFSRGEQIFLSDIRNQWVHSYLANRHREKIRVKHSAGQAVVVEKLPADQYHALLRPFYLNGLDQTLTPMRSRFFNMRYRYWHALKFMQENGGEVYRILRERETFVIKV